VSLLIVFHQVHANRYYQLEVSYFKSQLDSNLLELLWSKYWVNTLASNSLSATKSYMTSSLRDLSSKIDGAESSVAHGGRLAYFSGKKKEETQLSRVAKVGAVVFLLFPLLTLPSLQDSTKITMEQIQGLMTQVIKNALFNGVFSETQHMFGSDGK
jgi:COP9 signalosome complex subunit 5